MWADNGWFKPEKVYIFNCEATFTLNGQVHKGSSMKAYSTDEINERLEFDIQPRKGQPFN